MAQYASSLYGNSVYGLGTGVPVTSCSEPTNCFVYDRFVLSGVNLGAYIFDLNPTKYDGFRRPEVKSYATVMSTNPTIDVPYNKIPIELSWDQMPQAMWDEILPYARKYRDGTSEDIYFWDGAISGMQGIRVRIEDLKGEVRGGYEPVHRFNVSMKLRIATA